MLTCPPCRNRWRPLRSLLGTLLNSSLADSPTRFRGRRETALRCHEFFGTLRAVGIDVDGGRPERFLLSPATTGAQLTTTNRSIVKAWIIGPWLCNRRVNAAA
jgi:hypothetical protein